MKKLELAMQTGLVPRSSDTGKDITLRNASEHKRLEGHLKHLDHQLRSKLVSMQAEIMELKASQYGQNKNYKRRPPRLLESRDRANSDGRLHQRQRRTRTLTKDGDQLSTLTKSPFAPPSTPETSDQVQDSKSELVLPEINPKQICLVGNTNKSSNDRNSLLYQSDSSKRKNKSGTSCLLDNGFLNVSSLSTFGRPNSLPDLSRLGSNGQNVETVSPRSARRVKFALPEQNNPGQNNSIASDNCKEPGTEYPSSLEPQNTLAERINDFIKQTETIPSIEVSQAEKDGKEDGDEKDDEDANGADIFYNSMLTKATMDDGFAENAPDLASLGFMDFNEVIDKRLKQTQEELPSEEEMRKIRYLRWRKEAPQVDLVKAVFEKQKDIINVEANAKNLDINDSKPQLLSDNNEDNRFNPCES